MKYLNETEIRNIIREVDPRIGVLELQCYKNGVFIKFMQNDILFEEDIQKIFWEYRQKFRKKNPRTEKQVSGKIERWTLKIEIN